MSWYAIDELGESLDQTKDFLIPFDKRLWLKLAFIVLFASGSTSSFHTTGTLGQDTGGVDGGELTEHGMQLDELSAELTTSYFFISLLAAVFILALLYSYLSAVFTFVFYRSVNEGDVELRSSFRRHAYDGLKYFVFKLGIAAITLLSVAVLVLGFVSDPLTGGVLLLFLLPFWFFVWLVSFYVKNIVLPEIVVHKTGFIEGLRNAYGHIRDGWQQAVVFLLVKVVIGIVAAVLVGIALVAALVVLAIPLVVVGIILYLINPWLVAVPVGIGGVGLIVTWFAVSIPVETYVYTWVMNTYGEFTMDEDSVAPR